MIRDKADFRNTRERLKIKGDSIWLYLMRLQNRKTHFFFLFFSFKANKVKIVNIHKRHDEDSSFPRKFFWKLYHTKVKYKFKFKIEQWFEFGSIFFEKFSQICQGSANIVKRNQKADFPRKFSRLLLTDPKKKNLCFN